MAKKLFAIVTKFSKSAVYAVEAEDAEAATQLLLKTTGGVRPVKPAFNSWTSEDIVAVGESSLEDMKNVLDLASMIPNNEMVMQENVSEDELDSVIIREVAASVPSEGEGLGVDPFARFIKDLENFIPNSNDKPH